MIIICSVVLREWALRVLVGVLRTSSDPSAAARRTREILVVNKLLSARLDLEILKGQTALPTGVVAALSGQIAPTAQILTSNGLCIGATLAVTKDDGVQYQAQKK